MMMLQCQIVLLILLFNSSSIESWFIPPLTHQRACCSAITAIQSSAAPALQQLWPFSSTTKHSDVLSTAHRSWNEADFDEEEQINMLIITRDSNDTLPDHADLTKLVQQCPAFKRELTVSAIQSSVWIHELLQPFAANLEGSNRSSCLDWLEQDITNTAAEFAASLVRRDSSAAASKQQQQAYELIVKLEVIDSKTLCPNFHVDKVDRRLICTYVGSGKSFKMHITISISSSILLRKHQRECTALHASAGVAGESVSCCSSKLWQRHISSHVFVLQRKLSDHVCYSMP
jgi:hypothetical protein